MWTGSGFLSCIPGRLGIYVSEDGSNVFLLLDGARNPTLRQCCFGRAAVAASGGSCQAKGGRAVTHPVRAGHAQAVRV